MAKKKKAGKWIQKLRIGSTTITVRGKTKKSARANGLRFAKRHLKNVSSGFRDAQGRFHPMRYTYTESGGRYRTSDYSEKKAAKGAAKAATKRSRPMR
jgi:hypothetical protein